jgi:hypothetical protein
MVRRRGGVVCSVFLCFDICVMKFVLCMTMYTRDIRYKHAFVLIIYIISYKTYNIIYLNHGPFFVWHEGLGGDAHGAQLYYEAPDLQGVMCVCVCACVRVCVCACVCV